MSMGNILSTSALDALIDSAGAVFTDPAFANDSDTDVGLDALALPASDAGHGFFFDADSYVDDNDIAGNVGLVEEADLLDIEFDAVDIH